MTLPYKQGGAAWVLFYFFAWPQFKELADALAVDDEMTGALLGRLFG